MYWHDEFTGPAGAAPNPAKWNYDLGNQEGFGSAQVQEYTSSRANSFLSGDGHLVIRAIKTAHGFTSARLKTQGHFSALNGTWAARIKLEQTPGTWPAWWFLGTGMPDWPACGEVDVVEQYGVPGWGPQTSIHTAGPDGGVLTYDTNIPAIDSKWHEWGMSWNAEARTMSFFKDSTEYWETAMPSFPWPPMFTVLNLAVGGTGGGSTESTPDSVDMKVDYVRCWV